MQAASQVRRVAEINVTPLIDIVLVLLIVFIVMVPMTARHHPVAVPAVVPGASGQPACPVITVSADGSCTLAGAPVTLEELAARLVPEVLRQSRLARRVQLKVDGAVPVHRTTEVLDAIRLAGDQARRETPGYVPAPDEGDRRHEDDIKIAMTLKRPG
ncbi:MAG: biopolymer transporter ExbD [Acidobacteriota bacterium]|nr:biopolymer transporter ExbD [Acidobacteriota bacterium]